MFGEINKIITIWQSYIRPYILLLLPILLAIATSLYFKGNNIVEAAGQLGSIVGYLLIGLVVAFITKRHTFIVFVTLCIVFFAFIAGPINYQEFLYLNGENNFAMLFGICLLVYITGIGLILSFAKTRISIAVWMSILLYFPHAIVFAHANIEIQKVSNETPHYINTEPAPTSQSSKNPFLKRPPQEDRAAYKSKFEIKLNDTAWQNSTSTNVKKENSLLKGSRINPYFYWDTASLDREMRKRFPEKFANKAPSPTPTPTAKELLEASAEKWNPAIRGLMEYHSYEGIDGWSPHALLQPDVLIPEIKKVKENLRTRDELITNLIKMHDSRRDEIIAFALKFSLPDSKNFIIAVSKNIEVSKQIIVRYIENETREIERTQDLLLLFLAQVQHGDVTYQNQQWFFRDAHAQSLFNSLSERKRMENEEGQKIFRELLEQDVYK